MVHNKLVSLVLPVALNNNSDSFIWLVKKNGVFSMQTLYSEVMKKEKISGKTMFWKAMIPLKVMVFFWYLKSGVILTYRIIL